MSPLEILGCAATGVALVVGIAKLAGVDAPLSSRSLRKPLALVQSKRLTWMKARKRKEDQRRIEENSAAVEAREQPLRDALRCTVARLHKMEQDTASYRFSEWKRQKRLCKLAVMDIVKYMKYEIGQDKPSALIVPTNYPTDSIIFYIGRSCRRTCTFQLSICVHPSPALKPDQFGWPELYGDSTMVLSMPLCDADLATLGWEFPDKWSTWFPPLPGRSQPQHMNPELMQARERLRVEPHPQSIFFGEQRSVPKPECRAKPAALQS